MCKPMKNHNPKRNPESIVVVNRELGMKVHKSKTHITTIPSPKLITKIEHGLDWLCNPAMQSCDDTINDDLKGLADLLKEATIRGIQIKHKSLATA